jgi:hypothetical protein
LGEVPGLSDPARLPTLIDSILRDSAKTAPSKAQRFNRKNCISGIFSLVLTMAAAQNPKSQSSLDFEDPVV